MLLLCYAGAVRILLTGFEPFGKLRDNPSQHLLQQLSAVDFAEDAELITERLPTAYRRSAMRIRELLDEHRPDLCICLGVAQNRRRISLERIAVNLDDCSLADNDDELLQGREIVEGSELALRCSMPLEKLLNLLATDQEEQDGPEMEISNHAGTFVCNHVYYSALEHVRRQGYATRCLFVHVPMTQECRAEDEEYGWELPSQQKLGSSVRRLAGRLASTLRAGESAADEASS